MTPEQTAIARRWARCAKLDDRPDRADIYSSMHWVDDPGQHPWTQIPDLSHYGTAAVMLRVALEHGPGAAQTSRAGGGWWVLTHRYCEDLGTAAALALLSIWEK